MLSASGPRASHFRRLFTVHRFRLRVSGTSQSVIDDLQLFDEGDQTAVPSSPECLAFSGPRKRFTECRVNSVPSLARRLPPESRALPESIARAVFRGFSPPHSGSVPACRKRHAFPSLPPCRWTSTRSSGFPDCHTLGPRLRGFTPFGDPLPSVRCYPDLGLDPSSDLRSSAPRVWPKPLPIPHL